ncbi:class D sortase [Shewanella marina]|uniref:class D sortase n=1 Tax=Shewanella marina TaxID=487319 RepID=UPI00047002C9|nr:class D sortase [Shewanella marina]
MNIKFIQRALRIIGLFCIAIFITSKWHQYQGHQQSVDLANQLIAKAHAEDNSVFPLHGKPESTLIQPIHTIPQSMPNMTDWSQGRIEQYSISQPNSAILGLLSIPKIDLSVAIFDGVDEAELNKGVGRVLKNSNLDGHNNLSLAGHRDSFFRKLGHLKIGDTIQVTDIDGNQYQFAVSQTWIVNPEHVEILKPTGKQSITLITCYPFYFVGNAPERYIVRADLI